MTTMKEDVAVIKEQLKQNKDEHIELKALLKSMDNKIDSLGNNFAGKWVEKIIVGVLVVIIGAIGTGMIYIL